MERKEFIVTSRGEGMPEALAATEKLGAARGLGRKENLRLRLLAEELFGMVRGIVGDVEARYTVGQEGESFVLRLAFEPELTRETRRQLIAVSTQGGNAAAKGFMGKLRDMIAAALLPGGSGPLPVSLSMGLMGVAGNSGPAAQQAAIPAARRLSKSGDWPSLAQMSAITRTPSGVADGTSPAAAYSFMNS